MGRRAIRLPDKTCPTCGREFNRKRFKGNTLEDATRFGARIHRTQRVAEKSLTESPDCEPSATRLSPSVQRSSDGSSESLERANDSQ